MYSVRLLSAALLNIALLPMALSVPARAEPNGARGEFFAREHCSTCHAIGRTGASPYPRAPTFRSLTEKYDVEYLAEALAEGISVGHNGSRRMPVFVLSVGEIDDLIAYLKSLDTGFPKNMPLSNGDRAVPGA